MFKLKKRLRYIYMKTKKNKVYLQFVGYSLVERIEMCIDFISGGVIEMKYDEFKNKY